LQRKVPAFYFSSPTRFAPLSCNKTGQNVPKRRVTWAKRFPHHRPRKTLPEQRERNPVYLRSHFSARARTTVRERALACAHDAAPAAAGARILREIFSSQRREKSKTNGSLPDTSKNVALFGADTKRNGLLYADTSKKEGEFPRYQQKRRRNSPIPAKKKAKNLFRPVSS